MKRFKMKAGMLALLALACTGAGVAALNAPTTATAETTNGFYMENGAAVSKSAEFGGIRWTTVVDSDWYTAQTESGVDMTTAQFGTLVAPTKNIVGELTAETEGVIDVKVVDGVDASSADQTYYSAVRYDSIVADFQAKYPDSGKTEAELLEAAYKLELTARSYAIVNGEYVYADTTGINTSRSARQVANVADLSGDLEDEPQAVQDRIAGYMLGEETRNATPVGEFPAVVDMSAPTTTVTANVAGINGTVEEVLIGANRVTATVDGTTVTITDASYSVEGETWVSVITTDGNIYSAPIIAATDVLEQASDFDIFGAKDNTRIQDGYYVLGGDIDMTGYTHTVYLTSQGGVKGYRADPYGLTGTFNGMGYTISNFGVNGYGLFETIVGGSVKNVALTGVYPTTQEDELTALAYAAIDATFENVYIEQSTLSEYRSAGAVLGNVANCDFINCVFKLAENRQAESDYKSNQFGSLAYYFEHSNDTEVDTAETVTRFNNTYIVSPTAMTVKNEMSGYRTYTTGDEAFRNNAYIYDASNATTYAPMGNDYYVKLDGVKRYNDVSAWQASAGDYSSFDTACWTLTNGIPTWKGLDGGAYVTVDGTFSAKDGVLVSGTGTTDLATAAFGAGATLVSATQYGNVLTVEDNAIKGVQTSVIRDTENFATGVGLVELKVTASVNGGTQTKTLLVKAYDAVIDEAEDLAIFNVNAAYVDSAIDYSAANTFDGYYILAKDINDSSYIHAAHDSTRDGIQTLTGASAVKATNRKYTGAFGLTGTFDGNGHTITNIWLSEFGLFGIVGDNGTVKNLAIKDVKFYRTNGIGASYHAYTILGFNLYNAKLTNLYICQNVESKLTGSDSVGGSTSWENVRYWNLVSYTVSTDTIVKDCVFEVEGDPTKYTAEKMQGGLFYIILSNGEWENSCIISANVSAYHSKGTLYTDAATVDGEACTASYPISGCERYTSIDKFEEATGETYESYVADLIAGN